MGYERAVRSKSKLIPAKIILLHNEEMTDFSFSLPIALYRYRTTEAVEEGEHAGAATAIRGVGGSVEGDGLGGDAKPARSCGRAVKFEVHRNLTSVTFTL